MKSPATYLLLSMLLGIGTTHAADRNIEVRLLKTSGVVPNQATLETLVEDPGAQVTPGVKKTLAADGVTKLDQTTSFRYASEYTSEGKPATFETKALGLAGEVSTEAEGDLIELKMNLSSTTADSPHIYEVKGVQVTMPVFEKIATETTLTVKPGDWSFLNVKQGEKTCFWAIRVSDATK